jgi:translation initiation factor IF-3
MEKVVEMLKDIAAIESRIPLEGRRMSLIFAAI